MKATWPATRAEGRTKRHGGPLCRRAAIWYVYLCYGIHEMLNLVVGPAEHPAAVLIRGVEGISGPGRLTRALGIDRRLNGLAAAPAKCWGSGWRTAATWCGPIPSGPRPGSGSTMPDPSGRGSPGVSCWSRLGVPARAVILGQGRDPGTDLELHHEAHRQPLRILGNPDADRRAALEHALGRRLFHPRLQDERVEGAERGVHLLIARRINRQLVEFVVEEHEGVVLLAGLQVPGAGQHEAGDQVGGVARRASAWRGWARRLGLRPFGRSCNWPSAWRNRRRRYGRPFPRGSRWIRPARGGGRCRDRRAIPPAPRRAG